MNTKHRAICRIALAYTAFVLYGSLMPWRLRALDGAVPGYLGLGEHAILTFSFNDFTTNLAIFAILGLLWSACQSLSARPAPQWVRFAAVVVCASLLSASIEFAQLHVVQRASSIHDWVANSLGAAAGAWAWAKVGSRLVSAMAQVSLADARRPAGTSGMRLAVCVAALPYLIALGAANHWYSAPWIGLHEVAARAAEVSLLPFFYHQEASTFVALKSVLWQTLLYAPLGAGVRMLMSSATTGSAGRPLAAAAIGAGTAAVMEGGRLFIAGQHPDLGNVVVAALAAAAGFMAWPLICGLARHVATRPRLESSRADSVASSAVASTAVAGTPASLAARVLSIGLVAAVAVSLFRFPVLQLPLAAAFICYALALLRWPSAWLWVLPAALPLVDLAPLSGRFFFDEFDLAVMLTLAVSLWQRAGGPRQWPVAGVGGLLWAAFAVAVVVSTLIGLLPLQALDANAFASYHSHYNALRIAKGFLWAFALISLLRGAGDDPADAAKQLVCGILVGLVGVTALAVWERHTYSGLFDFAQGYRVGAFFSSMHNGGSHIEAYLVMTVPFLLAGVHQTKSTMLRLAGAALFVAATYVLMVTYARGGYAAFALSSAIALGMFGRGAYLQRKRRFLGVIAAGVGVAVGLTVAILSSSFAQQRLATSAADLDVRNAHWREALRIMDPGLATDLFGMGLGRFPESYYYRNTLGNSPATFSYQSEPGVARLKLGSGAAVYVEQLVDVRPQRNYRLAVDLRSSGGSARLNVLLCARTYFMSYGCESATFVTKPTEAGWTHHEIVIRSNSLGAGSWLSRRPVKLSLENAARETTADIREVALTDDDNRNLVRNGDFTKGSDHWFFSSNFNHLPWHIKNLWVGLFFDMGWLGVATFALLLANALGGMAASAWRGSPYAAAALASAVGFLCVGLFDSLFDAPRLSLLFLLILAIFGWLGRRSCTTRTEVAATVPIGGAAVTRQTVARSGAEPPVPQTSTAKPLAASFILPLGMSVVMLAVLIAVASRMPAIPYNVRALPNPYHPLLAPLALAVFLFWAAGLPAVAARWLETGRRAGLLFPVAVVLHAVLAWALVRQAVLPAMIHKVAGSPILGWPWEWETLLRFGALQAALFVLLTGGCIAARVATRRSNTRALLIWLFWAACLFPLLHHLIVNLAATDNLTELMAGGGGPGASLMLALWFLLVGTVGSMFADRRDRLPGGTRRRLAFAALSIPFGYVVLWVGLESNVQKYGTEFSAFQFLLSADRQHYAGGWELGIRYIVFHVGVVGLIALAQFPLRRMLGAVPTSRGQGQHLSA